MQTIKYPSSLPTPLRLGYGMNHASPMMRTELQSGRARQRRTYTSVPTIVDVSWLMSKAQAQIFEAWFKFTVMDGAEWFDCKLRTPLGLGEYYCRFAEMYSGPELVGIEMWKFTAKLEIKDRQTLNADWSILPTFIDGMDIFDLAMNREWPEHDGT
jgi:hypothetical protein